MKSSALLEPASVDNWTFSVDTEMANGGHATWAACIFLAMLVGADAGPDNAHASELLSYVPRLPVAAGYPRVVSGGLLMGICCTASVNWCDERGLPRAC